ncbi:hypothetical protein COOONC_21362, partial [Cooperia oncophora]
DVVIITTVAAQIVEVAARIILPSNYYSSNCQSSCSNFNCNQYNGQYMNGQYIGQYNPCASTCCGGYNSLNSWPSIGSSVVYSGFNNGYYNPYTTNVIGNGVYSNTNPLTQFGPGPVIISNGIRRSPVPAAFTGTVSNGGQN